MAHKNKEIIKRTSDMTAAEYNRLVERSTHYKRQKKKQPKRKQLGQKVYANQ